MPFYVFDIEVDVYFKGILAGRQGTTDEYVFKLVRYHSDGSGPDAVDMLVSDPRARAGSTTPPPLRPALRCRGD